MECKNCHSDVLKLHWLRERDGWCSACFYGAEPPQGASANVIGDDIPGGVEIKHGICNEDGTPKKYYTKSSIRTAAFEAGYFQGDDTPKINPRLQDERAKSH